MEDYYNFIFMALILPCGNKNRKQFEIIDSQIVVATFDIAQRIQKSSHTNPKAHPVASVAVADHSSCTTVVVVAFVVVRSIAVAEPKTRGCRNLGVAAIVVAAVEGGKNR